MIEFLMKPWPWWFSGILIGFTVPLLYLLAGKAFGISSSFQQLGAMCLPGSKLDYLKSYDRKKGMWLVTFVIGIGLGGLIATQTMTNESYEFLPDRFYSLGGIVQLWIGGILIGFGTRYGGGCTSGHAITGISNLNWPSLVATVFFFVGGLSVTWGILKWIQ